jgi:hypothetical protein
VCNNCGIVTHAASVFNKVNDKLVYKGICIGCNPTGVPPGVWQAYNDSKVDAKSSPTTVEHTQEETREWEDTPLSSALE